VTFQLKTKFKPLLVSNDVEKLFEDVEVPLIRVLADIEREGINLDVNALKEFSAQLQNLQDILKNPKKVASIMGEKQVDRIMAEVKILIRSQQGDE
jgi:DNA polymerase-1